MSSIRLRKEEIVKNTCNLFAQGCDFIVLSQFNYMTVMDMKRLRMIAKERNAVVQVIKPTLLRLALQSKFPEVKSPKGQVLIVASKDIGAAAAIRDFKDPSKLTPINGILNGVEITQSAVEALSAYTSSNDIMTQLVVALFAPRARLAFVLQAISENQEGEKV